MAAGGANFKMDVDDKTDYESLSHEKRLQAAVHFTVAEICNEHGRSENCAFSKRAIANIADLTFKFAQHLGKDLELFAKHAKRVTINADDVKLAVHRNPQLVERLQSICADKKGNKKRSKTRKSAEDTADPQDAH